MKKRCTKCGELKSFDEYYNDKGKKDGKRNDCKLCNAKRCKQYRDENKERLSKQGKRYYQDNKERLAEWGKQYKEKNKEKILEQRKRYYQENKEKVAERGKQYREKNKEKITEKKKKYYEKNKERIAEKGKRYRSENKEILAERNQWWYQANKDRVSKRGRVYREENKEKIKEYMDKYSIENKARKKELDKQYQQKNKEIISKKAKLWRERNKQKVKQYKIVNKEKFRLYGSRRIAREKILPDTLTYDQWDDILIYFDGGCALTKDKDDIHLEHFIPVAWASGGGTTHKNCYPMCRRLNLSKHANNPFEWIKRYPEYQEAFNQLVDYLAKQNEMNQKEFEDYVYWCESNKVDIDGNSQLG